MNMDLSGLSGLAGLGDMVCPDYPDTSTCFDNSAAPPATCLPTGSMGPLAPGQVWCATGTGMLPGVVATGKSSVTPAMWLGLAGAVAVLVVGGAFGGRH